MNIGIGSLPSKIRIKVKSFNRKLICRFIKQVVNMVVKTGSHLNGPVPLPRKLQRITVLRSPHIDKKARDQLEIRTHKRLLLITHPNINTIEYLMRMDIPAELHISVNL